MDNQPCDRVSPYQCGSVVQLVNASNMRATTGALAEVVDGETSFPALHRRLCERIADPEDRRFFVWVRWLRDDPRCRAQPDGAYAAPRFDRHTVPISPISGMGPQDTPALSPKRQLAIHVTRRSLAEMAG